MLITPITHSFTHFSTQDNKIVNAEVYVEFLDEVVAVLSRATTFQEVLDYLPDIG